jgi:hypothetical protein
LSELKFCEECPLRGECVGEIGVAQVFDYADIEYPWFSRPKEHFRHIIQVADTDGNMSNLFHGVDEETMWERIAECPGPYEQPTKRFLREPIMRKYCGALVIRPNVAIWYAQKFYSAVAEVTRKPTED